MEQARDKQGEDAEREQKMAALVSSFKILVHPEQVDVESLVKSKGLVYAWACGINDCVALGVAYSQDEVLAQGKVHLVAHAMELGLVDAEPSEAQTKKRIPVGKNEFPRDTTFTAEPAVRMGGRG